MAKTAVKQCSCEHVDQDKMYGKKNRVHNVYIGKDGKTEMWRCTVCGKEKA